MSQIRGRRRSVPSVANPLAPLSNLPATRNAYGKTSGSQTASGSGVDAGEINRYIKRRDQLIRHLRFIVGGDHALTLPTQRTILDPFPFCTSYRVRRGARNRDR